MKETHGIPGYAYCSFTDMSVYDLCFPLSQSNYVLFTQQTKENEDDRYSGISMNRRS